MRGCWGEGDGERWQNLSDECKSVLLDGGEGRPYFIHGAASETLGRRQTVRAGLQRCVRAADRARLMSANMIVWR